MYAGADRHPPRGQPRGSSREWLWVLPAALVFGVFYLGALVQLLWRSVADSGFGPHNYAHALGADVYSIVFWNTAKVGVAVTLACLAIGYPLAYCMYASRSPGVRRFILILVLLPFWISALVRNYAWIVILSRQGILNSVLIALGIVDEPLPLMYNLAGVIIGMTYVLVPFMVLTLYSGMQGIDAIYLRASDSLGASRWMTFSRVFLPLSLPGIWAGCLLVFTIAIGFFITPALLGGGRVPMMATLIEAQVRGVLNWGLGSALAVILLAAVILVVLLFNRLLGTKAMFEAR